MLRRTARTGGLALLGVALAVWAAPAWSAPLGLSPGDEVESIEWDALKSNPGDGGFYDAGTEIFSADGRVTSVTVSGPSTIGQSGVEMVFDLSLFSQNVITNGTVYPQAIANAAFTGVAGGPDFVIRESGVNILFGNFSTLVVIQGNVNLAAPTNIDFTQIIVGNLTITGGATNLVNALGGIGGMAELILTGSIFGFDPSLGTLAGDGNIFNSDFNVSLSGTLRPVANAPFVPEPSTALLFAGGMLGLLGVTRRAGRRRS